MTDMLLVVMVSLLKMVEVFSVVTFALTVVMVSLFVMLEVLRLDVSMVGNIKLGAYKIP